MPLSSFTIGTPTDAKPDPLQNDTRTPSAGMMRERWRGA